MLSQHNKCISSDLVLKLNLTWSGYTFGFLYCEKQLKNSSVFPERRADKFNYKMVLCRF